jgi:hypothetical protein
MLPSGNDAAVVLAENFGEILLDMQSQKEKIVLRSGIDNE